MITDEMVEAACRCFYDIKFGAGSWPNTCKHSIAQWRKRMRAALKAAEKAANDELIEKMARAMEPDWFGDNASVLENYPGQAEANRERARLKARAAVAAIHGGELTVMPSDIRRAFYYPIEMPVTADGHGPATVGVDAVKITYEVWDQLLNSHGSHDNLPDAINQAIALNSRAMIREGEIK